MARETLDELVARYLGDGDEEAAEEVVRLTRRKLLAVARRIGSPQDAEDAVHTAYLSLHHKRGGALDAPIMPWLVTAVVRIAYRHKAREKRQAEICRRLAKAPSAISPPASAARTEEVARLRDRVDRLPGKYRDAVVLHYLQGLSTSEVASLLSISRDAVKKRLQRSRTLLAGALSPWAVYPLLVLPWLLADAARGSGAFALASTGGIMKAKGVVILATFTLAAGTAGFGTAVAIGARSEAQRPRTDSSRDRARADASLALLDQVARLEERARNLEAENRALRTDTGSKPQPAGAARAGLSTIAKSVPHNPRLGLDLSGVVFGKVARSPVKAATEQTDGADLIEEWRARLRENPDIPILKQGEEVLRKTRDFRGVEDVYREQLQSLGESSKEGKLVLTQLGHLHRHAGKYAESDESYERLRALTDDRDPDHAKALFHLAWNQRFQKNWDAAIRLFDEAGRAPGATRQTAAIARFNSGQLLKTSGDTRRARSEFEELIREYENDKSATTQYYIKLARLELK